MASIHLPLRELEMAQQMADSVASDTSAHKRDGSGLKRDLLEIVASTNEIFASLDEPDTQSLSRDELLDISSRLGQLVAKYDALLPKKRPADPELGGIHDLLEAQRERLDSLSETFTMGADPGFQAHAHQLIAESDRHRQAETATHWRDFVDSLHD